MLPNRLCYTPHKRQALASSRPQGYRKTQRQLFSSCAIVPILCDSVVIFVIAWTVIRELDPSVGGVAGGLGLIAR